MVDKSIKIKDNEYKKLENYRNKTQIPYWKIIKDIIECKLNLSDQDKTKGEVTESNTQHSYTHEK